MGRYETILSGPDLFLEKRAPAETLHGPVTDPRPDLTEDSAPWDMLLQLSLSVAPVLTQPLHTLRQGGARLRKDNNAYALRSSLTEGDSGLWESEASYKAEAAGLLGPHREKLIELLRKFNASLVSHLLTETQAKLIAAALEDKKICAVRSDLLGEVIYFANTWLDGRRAPRGAVVYTLTELANLLTCPPTPDELRQIHQAKKLFDGCIVNSEERVRQHA